LKESQIQNKKIKQLEEEGYFVVKLVLTNKMGIPDLLALKDGKALFLEVKRPNTKLTKLQEYRIQELKKQGFDTEVYKG
jgi:Holliday junction resolvase|tara:strand:+ start:380 stop:616 length:237 start_codon:yes stop_codon:yes gene_type:complete